MTCARGCSPRAGPTRRRWPTRRRACSSRSCRSWCAIGTSYRSAIFYTSDEQRRVAEDTIADVEASGLWPGKVVTEVVPAGEFWEAEPEHQDYLLLNPHGYTCHFPRPGWKLPARRKTDTFVQSN